MSRPHLHSSAAHPKLDDLIRRDENGRYLPIELPEWYEREGYVEGVRVCRERAAWIRYNDPTPEGYALAATWDAEADECEELLAAFGPHPDLMLLRGGEHDA